MKVLYGSDGWLFLDNDSNGSVSQYTGASLPTEATLLSWSAHAAGVKAFGKGAGKRSLMVVAPSKESVFSAFYPFPRASVTPIDCLQAAGIASGPVNYPVQLLRGQGDLEFDTYDRGETHWNDFGAFVIARAILGELYPTVANPIARNLFEFQYKVAFGDLDSKIDGATPGQRLFGRALADGALLAYDNHVHNTGRIWVFENRLAPDRTCLCFGDSFSVTLVRMMKFGFRRLVYVHSTRIDSAIVAHENPDCLVSQVAERFLIANPGRVEAYSVKAALEQKMLTATPEVTRLAQERLTKDMARGAEPFYTNFLSNCC